MPEIMSLADLRNMVTFGSPEQRSKVERLGSCRLCGTDAAWAVVDEGEAYCEEHAPWVDHALAAQVNRAVEPLALASWLKQRPTSWRAKEEMFGEELTPENRDAFEKWAEGQRGDVVLVPFLEDALGRKDLRVDPPVVQTVDYRPVTHLAPWTERFNEMLTWWAVGDEGADANQVLDVLRQALELDELAAEGPLQAIAAKGREFHALPPEMKEKLASLAHGDVKQPRTKRKGLLRRLFLGEP